MSVRECEGMNLTFPNEFHFGNWNLDGLLNLHRAIARVKTHWIDEFHISFKSFWNVNV
jgi:hypothetical protein